MPRVLIPFVEPAGAQSAIARLLAESPDPGLSVHPLAAVEPLLSASHPGENTKEQPNGMCGPGGGPPVPCCSATTSCSGATGGGGACIACMRCAF